MRREKWALNGRIEDLRQEIAGASWFGERTLAWVKNAQKNSEQWISDLLKVVGVRDDVCTKLRVRYGA